MQQGETLTAARERLHRLAEEADRCDRWARWALDGNPDVPDWDAFAHWSARAQAAEEAWAELARQLAEAPCDA